MPKLPINKKPLLIVSIVVVLGLILLGIIYLNQVVNGDVVAQVGAKTLTKEDLAQHDRIYNGVLRFQQKSDKTVVLHSSKEVLDDLIRVTKMDNEAAKRKISPKPADIEAEKENQATKAGGIIQLKAKVAAYGWSDTDLDRNIHIQLVKRNLEAVLIAWREAEFIALRWDVLKDKNPDLNLYKSKAKEFLKAKEARFASGEEIVTLANLCREDKEILNYFPRHAIGAQQLSNDAKLRSYQRTTADKTNVLDKKILTMKVPTKSEIWCDDAACYLIRIVGGNSGTYESLDEWVKTQ